MKWSIKYLFLYTILALLFMLGFQHSYKDRQYKVKLEETSPDEIDLNQTVFVTAVDAAHFEESKDSIASVQKHLPAWHQVLLYDLGLTRYQVEAVKHWCRVIYVKFNKTKYPPHVSTLKGCAFKAIIIKEVLQTYEGIVWFDASIRFRPNPLERVGPGLRRSGITTVMKNAHSTFAVTHKGMYTYLSTNLTYLQQNQFGAGVIFLLRTKDILEGVIEPWVNCSLTKECIAPNGSKFGCRFEKDNLKTYANCHRYDQSALTIILYNHFRGNTSLFYQPNTVMSVIRRPTHMFNLQIC